MMRAPRRAVFAGAAGAVALAASVLLVPGAEAEPADQPVTTLEGEWACLALGSIDVGMCLDNPLPDMSRYDNVLELVADLLTPGKTPN